jgi:hypothetical protein
MTDVLIAIFAAVIALSTYLVWRTYERIAWLTGAMESNSESMYRMAAQREGIECYWWGPSLAEGGNRWPPFERKHDEPAVFQRIYVGFPREHWARQPEARWRSAWRRLAG